MSFISFGIRKPVASNLVMLTIIGAGLLFGLQLRREFFPEVRPNQVLILAPYPGASPDEIEDALAIKIEDRVRDLRDIKEINTTITEGAASIMIEFEPGIDIDTAVARVKREIDALEDLPERSEQITVDDFEPLLPVISLTVYGDADERTMKDVIKNMRDDLRLLPGMGDIVISGVRTDEISVEVQHEQMIQHGVSLPAVAQRVREAMAESPGGAIRTPSSVVPVRTIGADDRVDEVRQIVAKSDRAGRSVRLGEIATVSAGFADVDLRTRLGNQPAVSLTAYAKGKEDVPYIASLVKAYAAGRERSEFTPSVVERIRVGMVEGRGDGELPARVQAYETGLTQPPLSGLQLITHNNLARLVSQRLELLSRNATWGLALVFATLLLLLAPRVAIWVTMGLFISVLGTLAVMYALDISLNFLTMFGLIIVLGLLVDDAIIVAENISARHEAGEPALSAAEAGAKQVAWPVVATVLTSIAAFFPLRFIEGRLGDMLGALPVVVACALGVSLLESLFILPSHMGHSLLKADRRGSNPRRWLKWFEHKRLALFERILTPGYMWFIRRCLGAKYLTLALAVAIVIFSAGMIAGGRVPFTFMTSADSEIVVANLSMPVGTAFARTDEAARRIEAAVLTAEEVNVLYTIVGATADVEGEASIAQSHRAQFFIELKPIEERDRRSEEVIDTIRAEIGEAPGVKSLRFEELQGGVSGPDVTLTVTGDALASILPVVERVKSVLRDYEGVFGIADDSDAGQRELQFRLRPGADQLGLTVALVAEQVRAAVYGLEAHTFAGDREDVDVRVMLDEEHRRSLAAIESMYIFTPSGQAVPLREVVHIEEARSYASVRRLDSRRAVTVTADVENAVIGTEDLMAALTPRLREVEQSVLGVNILPRGRQKEVADSMSSLPLGMLVAITIIYVILAWLFASYTKPLIVLCAVPFATVGAIWGHFILGFDVTILSLIGFVALTGIVVNDSLILMQFYGEERAAGSLPRDALLAAGRARLRAILLTTMTTVLGLSPLMLEQSFQARFLIPMAITISFGLIAATMVTLVVLPCLVLAGHDVRHVGMRLWYGRNPAQREHKMMIHAASPSTGEAPIS